MHPSHSVKFLTEAGIVLFNNSRITIFDTEFYYSLWQDLLTVHGIDCARNIFIRFGYSAGYADAIKFYELIHTDPATHTAWFDCCLDLIGVRGIARLEHTKVHIDIDKGEFLANLHGTNCFEAQLHRLRLGGQSPFSCYFLAGYLSGFTSMNMDKEIVFQETSCMGNGQDICSFTGKPAEEWDEGSIANLNTLDIMTKEDKFQKIVTELHLSDKKYRDLYDNAPLMYFSFSPKGRITDCNRTAYQLLGYTSEEIIGMHVEQFFLGYDPSKFWNELEENQTLKNIDAVFCRKDKTVLYVTLDVSACINQLGIIEKARCAAIDITDRKMLELKLKDQNRTLENINKTDALTDLFNRRYLMDIFESEFANADRYSYPLTFIILDLDRFKQVNDYFGHQVGDDVLKKVGAVLKQNVRKGDIVARFGGEEFVILAPHADLAGGLELADKVRKIIQKDASLEIEKDVIIYPTASFGVATYYNKNYPGLNFLIQAADDALLKSKRTGRNKVTLSDAQAYS